MAKCPCRIVHSATGRPRVIPCAEHRSTRGRPRLDPEGLSEELRVRVAARHVAALDKWREALALRDRSEALRVVLDVAATTKPRRA